MHSDSIATNSSNIIPMASSNAKDFAKKKRVNRSAKLKQCKLDARREQWLSKVNKCSSEKEDSNGVRVLGPLSKAGNVQGRAMEKLEIRPRGEEENHGLHIHHYSDSESPSNSPMSHNGSILGGNDSGTTFTGSSRSSVSSSRSSSSSRSGGSCSGSMSEEDEEGDDECLDDWETVADALAATEEKHKPDDHSLDTDTASESKDVAHGDSHPDDATGAAPDDDLKAKPENGISLDRSTVKCRAWRPDDVFRPQSLPNLSKQYSFPMNPERYFGCGGSVWGCKNVRPAPTSCPICYEDLDYTDSSFIPCSCGFKLCLFCHKRILEEDGRCPGCRQQYKNESGKVETLLDGNSLAFRLARSCSMVTRS